MYHISKQYGEHQPTLAHVAKLVQNVRGPVFCQTLIEELDGVIQIVQLIVSTANPPIRFRDELIVCANLLSICEIIILNI